MQIKCQAVAWPLEKTNWVYSAFSIQLELELKVSTNVMDKTHNNHFSSCGY